MLFDSHFAYFQTSRLAKNCKFVLGLKNLRPPSSQIGNLFTVVAS